MYKANLLIQKYIAKDRSKKKIPLKSRHLFLFLCVIRNQINYISKLEGKLKEFQAADQLYRSPKYVL